MERIPVEVPAEMNKITASFKIIQPNTLLDDMKQNKVDIQNSINEERLLADIVKEKTGLDNFKFNKITKAGFKPGGQYFKRQICLRNQ